MLQIIIKGQLVSVNPTGNKSKGTEGSIVELKVRQWLQGDSVDTWFAVTLDKYWTDRLLKLDKRPQFLTFRCSALSVSVDPNVQVGTSEVTVWLKGEEWFL